MSGFCDAKCAALRIILMPAVVNVRGWRIPLRQTHFKLKAETFAVSALPPAACSWRKEQHVR